MPVRRIEDHVSAMEEGDIGIVTRIVGEYISLNCDVTKINYHLSDFLEPAYKLEVGCKVKSTFIKGDNSKVGVVRSLQRSNVEVDFEDGNSTYIYSQSQVIVIEPAPVKNYFDDLVDAKHWGYSKETLQNALYVLKKQEMDTLTHASKHSTETLGAAIVGEHEVFNKIYTEEWKMPEEDRRIASKLAEKTKDELVGFDIKSNTVFLKRAGEVKVLKREVTMTLTDTDIEKLLKTKGLDATLDKYEIERLSRTYTVGIVKFEPVQKELNEAV